MKHRFPASALRGLDVGAAVAAFLAEHAHWREHMQSVAATPETHQAYPAPDPAPVVAQAIAWDGDGVPFENFEVYDDGPTPEQALRSRKDALIAEVSALEAAAAATVEPPAKRRWNALRLADVLKKELVFRTADDLKIIAAAEVARRKLDAIERHGAQLHAEIEDLAADDVEGWEPKEFPR